MVGVTGFEPATSWSQTRRSTKLSYTPKMHGESEPPPSVLPWGRHYGCIPAGGKQLYEKKIHAGVMRWEESEIL